MSHSCALSHYTARRIHSCKADPDNAWTVGPADELGVSWRAERALFELLLHADQPPRERDAPQRRVTGCKALADATRLRNGVAFPADNRASDVLRRLLEVLPRGLRRLWDGALGPISLAQSPARQHLAEKTSIFGPALCYNYPFFTGLVHLLGA